LSLPQIATEEKPDPRAQASRQRNQLLQTFGNLTILTQALNSSVSTSGHGRKPVPRRSRQTRARRRNRHRPPSGCLWSGRPASQCGSDELEFDLAGASARRANDDLDVVPEAGDQFQQLGFADASELPARDA
jgi:hypothetical protein